MHQKNRYLAVEYQEHGEVRPTLVVGLGGSGVYTARRLKQILCERYDTQGLIRFVYVDTDQGAMSQEPNLAEATSDEILTLSIAHPEQIVDEWRRNRALHPYLEFLNGDVNVGMLRNADGAAGIRPIGRFGFHASFDLAYPRLQRAVQEIMQVEEQVRALMATVPYKVRVLSSQPRIYLIASLCGGTGSGIYFDTALVLRELLQQQNLDGELVGVFYLPSVFQHEAGISPSMREVIHANAYAALMELEYFCNANYINRDNWQVQYRMIPPIRIKEPLVDEAYLVEGANAAGRTLSSKYEVFEMTARSLLMDIGSPLGARARSAKRNSLAVIDAIRCAETGEPRLFASLAVASIAVPIKELTEYCALRVALDKLSYANNAVYSLAPLKEAEQFLQENGLTPESIRKALTDKVDTPSIRLNPNADLTRQVERESEKIEEYARNLRTTAEHVSKDILKRFEDALNERIEDIRKNRSEAEAAQFAQSVAQKASENSTHLTTTDKSLQEEIQQLKTQLEGISVGQSWLERLRARSQSQQRAQNAERLLKQLVRKYEEAEVNQIIQQLYSSDAANNNSLSVKKLATQMADQINHSSDFRQKVISAIQQRLKEIEHAKPKTAYSLEQLACLRRHFEKFYNQHADEFTRSVEITINGNTIFVVYLSGERRDLNRYHASSMHDLINKLAWMIADAVAKAVRDRAKVMEFLKPLYDDEPDATQNSDIPYLERKVSYLMQIAKPFWSAAQPPGDVRFEEFLAVSVPLSPSDFQNESAARELLNAATKLTEQAGVACEQVKDGYPFALTILNRTYGARAYYLSSIYAMKHSYRSRARNAQVRAHLHLDARFAELPDLIPTPPEASLSWAMALAMGYVAVIDGKYYFGMETRSGLPPRPKFITQRVERLDFKRDDYNEYLQGAYREGDSNALLGESYNAAFREFTREETTIDQVMQALEHLHRLVGTENLQEAIDRYCEVLLNRANEHGGEPNYWRQERELLKHYQPMKGADYVLSNHSSRRW